MSTLPVINALRRKRAELAGLIRDLEKRAAAIRRDLAHVDATLKLMAPGEQPRLIKPIRPHHIRNRLFDRKELSIRVMNALREAGEAGATIEAIAAPIMAAKGLEPIAEPAIRRLALVALKGLQRRGVVRGEGKPPVWKVAG